MRSVNRLSAVLLCLGLLAGSPGLCAGWTPSPEARMACCAESGACPMHGGEHGPRPDHAVTQAQADSCCASSEGETPTPSSPAFVTATSAAILGPAIVQPASVPALVLTDAWRTIVPAPAAAVPRHVLLSIFLV